jgi:hypothetical protein
VGANTRVSAALHCLEPDKRVKSIPGTLLGIFLASIPSVSMSNPVSDFNAIVQAVKESVTTGDEGLLDAAIDDYSGLVAHLANSRQFSNLQSCLSAVGHALKITDLINRKESLSPAIFSKVLSITIFHFNGIPSKRDVQTDYHRRNPDLPPNAGQSLIIAKAFVLACKSDLCELLNGVYFFAKMGHHQALGVLLEHYFSNGMHDSDEGAVLFTRLVQLKTENSLQASITKVLNNHNGAFLNCVKAACSRIAEKHANRSFYSADLFTLPLIEAFHDAGFHEHAQIMVTTYVRLLPMNGSGEVPCLAHRIRRMGADHDELVVNSRAMFGRYYSADTSPAWMEDLLTNPAIDQEQMVTDLSMIRFKSYRENKGFQACEAVLLFAKNHGAKFGLNYQHIIEKAAVLCSIEIHERNLHHEPNALKKILTDFKFPLEMILKVKPLKGAHLENELGL